MKIKWNHKKYLTNPKESRERRGENRWAHGGKSYADNFKPKMLMITLNVNGLILQLKVGYHKTGYNSKT